MAHQVIIINNELKLKKGKIGRVCSMLGARMILEQKASYNDIWKCVVLKSDGNYAEIMDYLNHIRQDFEIHVDAGFTQCKPLSNCGLSFIYPDGVKYPLIDKLKLL